MNNAVFEKNHEENEKKKNTSKFYQPKKKTIWCQNQILIQEIFYLQIY